MEKLTDGLKKVVLAGIGTVAVTAEKSKEIIDEMAKRGQQTVEQGKVLNQELKHNIKETVKKTVGGTAEVPSQEALAAMLDQMTPEQIAELKAEKAGLISLVAGAIEQLEDDFEKTVLAEFYIGRRSMRDVARAIGYSPRRAYYFRKQGVLHLSTLLGEKSANIAN